MANLRVNLPPESPRVLDRGGVLEALGYQADKAWKPLKLPEDKDVCHRCGKKVYPVEKVYVGELYHRGCFKCRVCYAQLSLRNFQQQVDPGTHRKEVYCNIHVPRHAVGLTDKEAIGIKAALDAQKAHNAKRGMGGPEEGWEYDYQALEFQHLHRDGAARGEGVKKKVRRSSTLRSFKDFERYGIFDAQSALERVQKQEEDQLYIQMAEDRQVQIRRLEDFVVAEKQRTVKDLVHWYQQKLVSAQERDDGIKKVDQYYGRILEERMKLLLHRLAAEEQAAVARMTEKHATEMIALIADKENEVEEDMKRQQERFEQKHRVEQQRRDEAESAARHTEEVSRRKEVHNSQREQEGNNPDLFYNQVEFVGHMGTKHQKFSTSHKGSREDVVVQAASKPPTQLTQEEELEFDRSIDDKTKQNLKLKLIQGTSSNPTSRQLAAGFVPITPVLKEVRGAPGHVDWSGESSDEELGAPVNPVARKPHEKDLVEKFSSVKVDVEEDDNLINNRREEFIDETLDDEETEEESEEDDDDFDEFTDDSEEGLDDSKSTPDTLNSTGSGASAGRVQESYDVKGKPFVKLGKPTDVVKQKPRKATHLDRKRRKKAGRGNYTEDSEMMEGSYNVEEAEFRDNKINEEIHRSMFAEVSPPKVIPPQNSKSSLYTDPAIFAALDNNAIEEAKKDHKTYTELVRQLSVRCDDELQKVRAIFRWLTVKDLNKIKFDETLDPDSPMALLSQIKQGAESYHNLFKRLCSYAGLHCEIIEGYSKGAGYKPGTRIQSGDMFRNQWTAVCVEGSWRFINTNWGARHVKGPGEEAMTYKCDEFYFLTEPSEHVYQHFPDDPVWQLLRKPLSLDQFLRSPVVKSPFFNLSLAFSADYQAILETASGFQEIRLMCPHWYNFAGKLRLRDNSIPGDALQERLLIRSVGQDVVFLMNFPKVGKYYLDIFVAPDPRSESMDHACGFMINCTGLSSKEHHHTVYPQIGMFGRTPYFDRFKFEEETHPDPYITCKDDVILALTMRKPVRMSHSYRYFDPKDRSFIDCDRFVFLKHKGDSIASYIVRCPKKGMYVFTVMAESYSESTHTSGNTHSIFTYFIDCKNTSSQSMQPFPKTSKRWHHCKLMSPFLGDLPVGVDVRFKLDSTVAQEMVVVVGEKWNHLECSGTTWQGVVNTGGSAGKLFVYGRLDTTRKKYIPCLEYYVVEKKSQ